jgi:hypothetical protein
VTTPTPDAPNAVWNVRQVPPPGQSLPDKQNKLWQPILYERHERKADGLWVWKMVRPLTKRTYKTETAAAKAGHKHSGGVPLDDDVRQYDLSIRLANVVPDGSIRSRIRLGEGWKFLLVAQEKSTSRGTKYLVALCEHDRPTKSDALGARTRVIEAWNRSDRIALEHRIGRFNERQFQQLAAFCRGYDIHDLNARSLPVKPGNRLAPKHYVNR